MIRLSPSKNREVAVVGTILRCLFSLYLSDNKRFLRSDLDCLAAVIYYESLQNACSKCLFSAATSAFVG